MNRSGIIYKTTNLLNGKWYIGKYEGDKSSYLGSGVALTRAIEKYGKENFKRETLAEAEIGKTLSNLEKQIISETNAVVDPMSYNIASGGHGGRTWDYSFRTQEHCDKISLALTGKKWGKRKPESFAIMSAARRLRNDVYKISFVDTGNEVITDCIGDFAKQYGIAGKTLRYSAKENTIVKSRVSKTRFLVTKVETK